MKHVIKMWKQSYYGQQLHGMSNDGATVWKLLVLERETELRESKKEQNWKLLPHEMEVGGLEIIT